MKEYVIDGKVVNITLDNGKVVKASTVYLENMVKNLDIDMEEAVLTWLEDEEYLINDEQEELVNATKNYKLNIKAGEGKERKKKEVVKKENPVKKATIDLLAKALQELDNVSDIAIENETKLITFKVGDREFKLDLIEKRQKKA